MTVWDGTLPSLLSGDIPPADDWDEILDALHALTDSWTDYASSLTWTATTTNPAFGAATKTAAYARAKGLVVFRYQIVMAADTTYGTGIWIFSLPIACANQSGVVAAFGRDQSLSTYYAGAAWIGPDSASSMRVSFGGNTAGAGPTVPFTWASTDRIIIAGVYPAA